MISFPENYRIEYQPQLIEEAALRAISGNTAESLFRKQREVIYDLHDSDAREDAFQNLHQSWFERLGLSTPLAEALSHWPILTSSTQKCLLVRAHSKKDMGAELYVNADAPKAVEHDASTQLNKNRHAIVIQVTAELLCQSKSFLAFLRHELLHIVDMLDPEFGYEPQLPGSKIGLTYERFLKERYRILWDITIDGRLVQQGWLAASIRDRHWTIFQNTFPGPIADLEKIFSFFFDNGPHTHEELVSFSQTPEMWFVSADSAKTSKGLCSLCNFPSFDLMDASTLPSELLEHIQKESPQWQKHNLICRQCADLLESRFHIL